MILGDDDLSCFLREARLRGFAWGTFDCLMWLSEWVRIRRGFDPGNGWRGSYFDEAGAARITQEAGGVVQHVERCLRGSGIARTSDPQRGDIAVVDYAGVEKLGAIVLSPPDGPRGTVVCVTKGGLLVSLVANAPIVAAWRI